MANPSNKTELLARVRSGYAEFVALLAPLSNEQLCEPGVNGAWTIKDILAHLTAWQTRVSLRLEALARHEEARFEPIADDEAMNAFNQTIFVANRERSLDEVRADFHAAVERLRANAERTAEDDLFTAGRFAWLNGVALWESVAGNTYEHYAEHAPMIEVWLAGQRA